MLDKWLAVVLAGCGSVSLRHPPDASDASSPPPGDVVLALAPTSHDFGIAPVGSASATQTFTVTNTGAAMSGAIEIGLAGGDSAQFARVTTTCGPPLATGGSCTVETVLAPHVEGMFATSLVATEASGTRATAALAGTGATGTIAISPSVDSFGQVILGTVTDHAFTVRNSGPVAITMPVPVVDGTAAYSLGATDCTTALAPNATCGFTVHFAPRAVGAQAASLRVSSNSVTAMGQLTGTGASQLVVTRTGPGAITGAGIDCGTACSTTVTSSPVTLTAVPSAGAAFGTWSGVAEGCGTAPTCAIPVTGGSLAAGGSFADIPTLTLTVLNVPNGLTSSDGQITITPINAICGQTGMDQTCSYDLSPQTVTLQAINDCSAFDGWLGACAGMGPTCTLSVTADIATTAKFRLGLCE